MTTQEKKNLYDTAVPLRTAKRFAEALPLFEQVLQEEPQNLWYGWSYGFCLKGVERYKEALDVARQLYKTDKDFAPGRSLYAWCIYLTEIRHADIADDERFMKAARAIADLSRHDDEDPCLVRTVMRVLRYLNEKPALPAEEVLVWSGMVHPEKLDTAKPSFKDGRGKDIELASQLENYYALRSKALLELGRYEECLSLCREALEKLDKFHYDNDVWFQRKMVQCHLHTGDIEAAEAGMNAVLAKKKDWFLYFEAAEICLQSGKKEEAVQHSLQAILAWGDMDKKVRLLNFIAEKFAEELPEISALCTRLEYKIRTENGWRTGDALLARLQRIEGAEATSDSVGSLAASLKKQVQFRMENTTAYLIGKLKSMLNTGLGGFIETAEGATYFFKTSDYRGRKEELNPGTSLRFQASKGFDRKKNRESDIALKVSQNP